MQKKYCKNQFMSTRDCMPKKLLEKFILLTRQFFSFALSKIKYGYFK